MSVVIHVGCPKTASTALQRHVFPSLPNCVAATPSDPLFRVLSTNLWTATDEEFRAATFRAYVDELAQQAPSVVLSREDWVRTRERWTGQETGDRSADRLARIAPDARILVVIRSQPEMMQSMYGQYLRVGGRERIDVWADSVLDRSMLHFDCLVARYRKRFGVDAVKVMLFEQFAADPVAFLAELTVFVDEDGVPEDVPAPPVENAALGTAARWAHRVTNRHLRRVERNPTPYRKGESLVRFLQRPVVRMERRLPFRVIPAATALERDTVARHASEFAVGNAELARMTGLPLGDLGYPIVD